MKIDFVKQGQDFEIPTVSLESDIQMTIDFLKIKIKIETEIARDLGLDLKEMRKELTKAQADKNYELSEEAKSYNSIVAIQLNLDTVYYVLHRVDPTVTKQQVSMLGGSRLSEIIMAVFPLKTEAEPDFPKATGTTVAN